MKKLKNNEQGFGVVEILLVILIMAVVGFGGYYVYHSQSKTDDAKTTVTSTPAPTTPATTTPAKTVDDKTLITQAVKDYEANTGLNNEVSITAIEGVNAYGKVDHPNQDGGAQWVAHKTASAWTVVSQSQFGICKDLVQQYNLPAGWESPDC